MKKLYSEPEMEVVGLSREDMILTSGECYKDGEDGCDCDAATGTYDYLGCDCHGHPSEEK